MDTATNSRISFLAWTGTPQVKILSDCGRLSLRCGLIPAPKLEDNGVYPLGAFGAGTPPCIFLGGIQGTEIWALRPRLWTSRRYACKSASSASQVNRSNVSETPSAGGGTGTQLRLVLSHVLSSRTSHLWECLGVLPKCVCSCRARFIGPARLS